MFTAFIFPFSFSLCVLFEKKKLKFFIFTNHFFYHNIALGDKIEGKGKKKWQSGEKE